MHIETQRFITQMIVTYKLLSGLYDEQVTLHFDMATVINTAGRPKCCRKRCEF